MNSVVLIGRLVRDPELRYTPGNQTAVTTFDLAVNRPNKNDETDYLRIVTFGRQAENCGTYLAKGSQVGVQGRIQTRSYEAKTGERRYVTEIVADRVEFLQRASGNAGGSAPAYTDRGRDAGGMAGGTPSDPMIPDGFHAFDDDDDENIPF